MIDQKKIHNEISFFKYKLTPMQNQKDAFELARKESLTYLIQESKKTGHPIERCLLVALCGEFKTKQQQTEFATRLILLDLLLGD